jgi:hypothetical protein
MVMRYSPLQEASVKSIETFVPIPSIHRYFQFSRAGCVALHEGWASISSGGPKLM